MEGLSNPDKLEALWEQSKAKKLWDESQVRPLNQLDRYLADSHPKHDSIPIEDYMGLWCIVIHQASFENP